MISNKMVKKVLNDYGIEQIPNLQTRHQNTTTSGIGRQKENQRFPTSLTWTSQNDDLSHFFSYMRMKGVIQ